MVWFSFSKKRLLSLRRLRTTLRQVFLKVKWNRNSIAYLNLRLQLMHRVQERAWLMDSAGYRMSGTVGVDIKDIEAIEEEATEGDEGKEEARPEAVGTAVDLLHL